MILKIFLIVLFSVIKMYTSSHVHNQVHSQQWISIMELGNKFDQELEKAKSGLLYECASIFEEMDNLADQMVCEKCKNVYQGIIAYNQVNLKKIEGQLERGELPKIDNEPGHYI